jgi:hypothetical protein
MFPRNLEMSSRNRNAIFAMLAVATLGAQPGSAAVPNPTVTGPIAATARPGDPSHNYPFFATNADLAGYGYIEEEFFFEGFANRYNMPALDTATIIDTNHPYRTRLVVRRPSSPRRFSGIVLLEWQNVSAGYDFDASWQASHDHIMQRGYAWVGVSAQRAGIHTPVTGLKDWSPARYGTLDVTEAGRISDDSLSYDIYSQAAQAVRHPSGIDPMGGGLPVKLVLAIGASQAANRLSPYHNSIHPLAGVVDAFSFYVGGTALRTDLDVKVFKTISESDVAVVGQASLTEPDSDHFRRWEVAGTSHVDWHLLQEWGPVQVRDGVAAPQPECARAPLSRIPYYFVANAATDHLVRWVTWNIAPPTAPRLNVVTLGPPVVIARDNSGNALGGIRVSQFAVPTATNTGVNSGPGFCLLFGSFEAFSTATLEDLYPNHGKYVSQATQAALEAMRNGWVVLTDTITTIQQALQSDIGKPVR